MPGDGIGPNKTMRTNSSLAPRARRRTESSPTCCSVRGFDNSSVSSITTIRKFRSHVFFPPIHCRSVPGVISSSPCL